MNKLIFLLLVMSSISVNAMDSEALHPLRLKDGSYVFINEDNNIRMVDKEGRPITMKDGVEMELEDGTLIMMKNRKIWRHKHQDMKR